VLSVICKKFQAQTTKTSGLATNDQSQQSSNPATQLLDGGGKPLCVFL